MDAILTQVCKEASGAVERSVYPVSRDLPSWLELEGKIGSVRNFLTKSLKMNTQVFLDQKNRFYRIDDVGVAAVFPDSSDAGHCHITFWDGRLRGREELMRRLAEYAIGELKLSGLYTVIPQDARAVLAFAKRVGFKEYGEMNKTAFLYFC